MRIIIILVLMVTAIGTSLGNNTTGKPKSKLSWIKAGQKQHQKVKLMIQRQRGECVSYW